MSFAHPHKISGLRQRDRLSIVHFEVIKEGTKAIEGLPPAIKNAG